MSFFKFLFVVGSYTLLYITAAPQLSVGIMLIAFSLIATGELFIGPAIWSLCGRNSPESMKGQMMGFVTLGYAASNYLGGFLSRNMAITETANTMQNLAIYRSGFATILLIAAACSAIAMGLGWFLNRRRRSS